MHLLYSYNKAYKKFHWLNVTIKATVVVKGNLQAANTVRAN